MSNGRTPRFGSYIGNILVSKASIKLTELNFGGVLAPKPRFSQIGRRNLFSRNPPYWQAFPTPWPSWQLKRRFHLAFAPAAIALPNLVVIAASFVSNLSHLGSPPGRIPPVPTVLKGWNTDTTRSIDSDPFSPPRDPIRRQPWSLIYY